MYSAIKCTIFVIINIVMNLSLENIISNSIPSAREVFSGVYFLIYKNEIQYIGSATDVLSRIQMHKKAKKIRFNKMFFIRCTKNEMVRIEIENIEKFRPINNIVYNPDYVKKGYSFFHSNTK